MTTIDDVRRFWNENPLWTGESRYEPGTREFFEEHAQTYRDDVFIGEPDPRFFPENQSARVLDLGCGIGFWLIEFGRRGFTDITGADIAPGSVRLARTRCELFGVKATIVEANAENLPFDDASFDHVNCSGVVHHTTDPDRAMAEIHRVLKPGGTATVGVYYRNFALRNYRWLRPALSPLRIALKGRGRESMLSAEDEKELIRLFDGAENPIGLGYDRQEFARLCRRFATSSVFCFSFPARALPFSVPRPVHRLLSVSVPFMIYGHLVKPDLEVS